MDIFTPEVIAIIWSVVKSLIVLFGVVICAAFLSFVERRLLALWQDRYGPNRAGPFGLLQLPADMIKMFFKEDWIPPFADPIGLYAPPIMMKRTPRVYTYVGKRVSSNASTSETPGRTPIDLRMPPCMRP